MAYLEIIRDQFVVCHKEIMNVKIKNKANVSLLISNIRKDMKDRLIYQGSREELCK